MVNAYTRAVDDPDFFRRVIAAYIGTWDVADALWWEEHPDEESPTGTPSPTAQLRELQHQVFSRAGGSFEDREAYRALGAEIEQEQKAIREAIAAAEMEPVREQPAPRNSVTFAAAQAPPRQARRSRRRPIVLIAAAAVLATAIAAVIGMQQEPAEGARPAALDVFDQPQTEQDVPKVQIPEGSGEPETFRSLMTVETSAGDEEYHVYGALNDEGICLLITAAEGTITAICESVEQFAVHGIEAEWAHDPVTSQKHATKWLPNGDVYSQVGGTMPVPVTRDPTPVPQP